jgi:hypothetical protein
MSTDYADYTDYVVWGQGDRMFVWFVVYHRRVEFRVSKATRYPPHVVEFLVSKRYALPTPRHVVEFRVSKRIAFATETP